MDFLVAHYNFFRAFESHSDRNKQKFAHLRHQNLLSRSVSHNFHLTC